MGAFVSISFRPVRGLKHVRAGNACTSMPNYSVYTPLPAVKHSICVCVCVCVCV